MALLLHLIALWASWVARVVQFWRISLLPNFPIETGIPGSLQVPALVAAGHRAT